MEHTKELLLIAEAVSLEKNIHAEDVLLALAEGMETALKRNFPEGATIKVTINPDSGEVEAFRTFKIVPQIENLESEMLESEIDDEVIRNGYALEKFNFKLNRQQFTITKQVALQKIKAESKEQHILDLLDRSNQLFSGSVKVSRKDQIIVDINGIDINIPRKNLLPRDNFKIGDKVFFVIEKEDKHYCGSRVSDNYLKEVFKREIVQIEEGDIEISSVARIPGFRSKVILKSFNSNLDPIKTCVGMKGVHIKNINNMLGENVDLISYDSNIVQLLIQSMLPIDVVSIIIDEDENSIDIAVSDDDIAKAIGKGGNNVSLISKLLGWNVNIFSKSQWDSNSDNDNCYYNAVLCAGLNCDEEIAQLIIDNGVNTLEEVAYLKDEEFYINELDDENIAILRQNAKDTLKSPETLKKVIGTGELAVLGFNNEQITLLQSNSVINNFDVSELSTFDLIDILSTFDNELASNIIVTSRKKEDKKNGSSN